MVNSGKLQNTVHMGSHGVDYLASGIPQDLIDKSSSYQWYTDIGTSFL